MAEATTVTYVVVHSISGIKEVICKVGNFTTGDTLTLTGAASLNPVWLVRANSASGNVLTTTWASGAVITFGATSGTGSTYVHAYGV